MGIPCGKVILVTETEAAALYCLTTSQDLGLNDSDNFVICDAGAITVVKTS